MIDTRGLARVATDLGIARESLARYLADIHVQVGTFSLIETTLSRLDERRAERCPRCDSPDRKYHPALQFEGEVTICPHPWHEPEPVAESAPVTEGGDRAFPR